MVDTTQIVSQIRTLIDDVGLSGVIDDQLLNNITKEAGNVSGMLEGMMRKGVSIEDAADWFMSSGAIQGSFYNLQKNSASVKGAFLPPKK